MIDELLKYQEADGKLRAIEQEIASTDERKKYMTARKFLEKAPEKLEALDARAAEFKLLFERLEKKYAEIADLSSLSPSHGTRSKRCSPQSASTERMRRAQLEKGKSSAGAEPLTKSAIYDGISAASPVCTAISVSARGARYSISSGQTK